MESWDTFEILLSQDLLQAKKGVVFNIPGFLVLDKLIIRHSCSFSICKKTNLKEDRLYKATGRVDENL